MPTTHNLPIDELDYGWYHEFERVVLPHTHTHVLGQDRLTNVSGPARDSYRAKQGHARRHAGDPRRTFSDIMREAFAGRLRNQLNRPAFFLTYADGAGWFKPDTRTNWERAMDHFYDPEERERRRREAEEDCCTCSCGCCDED